MQLGLLEQQQQQQQQEKRGINAWQLRCIATWRRPDVAPVL